MKKRIFVCFLIFSGCLFHLLTPDVVFGQSAVQVFGNHKPTFLHPDVQRYFPDILRDFKDARTQLFISNSIINRFVSQPTYIRSFVKDTPDEILVLLTINGGFQKVFTDKQFQEVLQTPSQIDILADLIEGEPRTAPEDPRCETPSPAPLKATTLLIVSGYGQEGLAGTLLQSPFVVEVRDQYGEPFSGANVVFRVTGGSLSSTRETTNSFGQAQTTLTLGPSAGANSVEASVAGISPSQTFTATATASGEQRRATTLTLQRGPGNDQNGTTNTELADPFVVWVRDQNGNLLAGRGVTFTVTKGGGHLSDETAITNSFGRAEATLTLGPMSGENKVWATVVGVAQPVIFTAEAEAEPIAQLPSLYWIEDGRLYRFTNAKRENLVTQEQNAVSLAVDMVGGKFYWATKTPEGKGKIHRANLDGTEDTELFEVSYGVPINIAVDPADERLYWTDTIGRIQCATLTAKNIRESIKNVYRQDGVLLKHVALDLERRDLYWTEDNKQNMSWSIWVVDLPAGEDGKSKNRKSFQKDLGQLEGITVADDKLYWTEKVDGAPRIVKYANVNGSEPKIVTMLESVPLGLAVDPVGGSLYWTTSHGGIRSVDLILGDASAAPANPRAAVPSVSLGDSVQSTLLANYPNPFNPETWIPYQLSEPAEVTVSIYSVNGSLIRTLALGHQAAGLYRSRSRAAYWDGRNAFGERVASGLYFYTLTAGDFTATRKMLIRK